MTYDTERLKSYAKVLARKYDGLAGLRHSIETKINQPARGGLESIEGAGDQVVAGACDALKAVEMDRALGARESVALEAIIDAELRPAIDVINGDFVSTHPLWTHLTGNQNIYNNIKRSLSSIGRVELPGNRDIPYGGTAFVVGPGLIMTNRHVAEIFAEGLGTRRLQFKQGLRAGIDFLRERDHPPGRTFEVRRILMVHPYWDMAVLAVDGIDGRPSLELSLEDARDFRLRDIAVVGYPAFDPRNPAQVQQDVFNGRYGIKRLQPGELQGGMKTASFSKLVQAATHDCSTLGGNSGSALIDLESGAVIALHFGGRYREQNFAVPSSELARDQRVIDLGVKFRGRPTPNATDWADWWKRADNTRTSFEDSSAAGSTPAPNGTPASVSPAAAGTLEVEVPIRISISVGASRIVSAQVQPETLSSMEEGLKTPWHDTDYSTRTGYSETFLDPDEETLVVPMPEAAEAGVLAPTLAGEDTLHYQNFSIRMHRQRRLALVVASNVTEEPHLREPDPDQLYTRKALSELGKNDQEKWFLDTRMDSKFQIPDVFFTKDRKAFDKGHLARRDDVAWGETYEELKRANGDSYHVTNCSPQTSAFNQSARGKDNWGDLENHVLSEAGSERLCVFAGPVLSNDDQMFYGVGEGGATLRARIPSRFWKVIVARVEDGLAAYGFVLEQDLDDVAFEEFTVPEDFIPMTYPLSEIAELTGVTFDSRLLDADQYDTVRGVEVAQRSGARRRKR